MYERVIVGMHGMPCKDVCFIREGTIFWTECWMIVVIGREREGEYTMSKERG